MYFIHFIQFFSFFVSSSSHFCSEYYGIPVRMNASTAANFINII